MFGFFSLQFQQLFDYDLSKNKIKAIYDLPTAIHTDTSMYTHTEYSLCV